MKGVNVLFDFNRYMVFYDPVTDYIWIYDKSLCEPVYIMKIVKIFKQIFNKK